MDLIQPIILCGGAGERLKPYLDTDTPKQFLALDSIGSGFTMLQNTILRCQNDALFSYPMLYGHQSYKNNIQSNLDQAGVRADVYLEPERRNTALPVTLAALRAIELGTKKILVMPSDHVITRTKTFQNDIWYGSRLLDEKNEAIIYFGVHPDHASTEYGYITKKDGGIHFHEKPHSEKAEALIGSGALWNSGIFLISPKKFIESFKSINPGFVSECEAILPLIRNQDMALGSKYAQMPNIAFDRAFCEKHSGGDVVQVGFDWCDIGSIEMLNEIKAASWA